MGPFPNPAFKKRLIYLSSFLAITLMLGLSPAWGQVPPLPANPPGPVTPPSMPAGSAPVLFWNYYAYGGLYQNGNMWTVPGSGGAFMHYFTVSADTNSVTFDYAIYGTGPDKTWSASGLSLPPTIHNGIAIGVASGTVIESVDINPATNMAGFDAARISFTGSQIQVDWMGLPYNSGTVVKLDVGFKGYPPTVGRHAVGDVDRDFMDEVAWDFGPAGIWLYDQGTWTQLAPENPEGLFALKPGPSLYSNIIADFGSTGLWRWEHGSWSKISEANAETMTSILAYSGWGSDGDDALVVDFGPLGVWGWPYNDHGAMAWRQLSGQNADYVIGAALHDYWDSYIGDFGGLGLWESLSTQITQISGSNAEYITSGTLIPTWPKVKRVVADFGPLGLWDYHIPGSLASGVWSNLTGADADLVVTADINADGVDEIAGDFGALGLWLWDSAQWTQLSTTDAQYLIRADVTGDGSDEIAVDFGPDGIWVWNNGPWSKISGWDPQYLLAADTNGDGAQEILADFGAEGLWLWNGAWTRLSEDNPD